MTPKQDLALEILASVSKKDKASIKPEQNIVADLGLDSPKQLQLLAEMEDKLHIEISDEEAARMNTVGDILNCVATKK
jgi:acyl carrier protein